MQQTNLLSRFLHTQELAPAYGLQLKWALCSIKFDYGQRIENEMIQEAYKDYIIIAVPKKTRNSKWTVAVKLEKSFNRNSKQEYYEAVDNIEYILEIEAAKECINLGKNLINKNMIKI